MHMPTAMCTQKKVMTYNHCVQEIEKYCTCTSNRKGQTSNHAQSTLTMCSQQKG
uniref:Uncharacterized protein n=1 Tax=Arundo donax TaxID=35708 RepID=A0A0A9FSE1_ARUDO